MSLETAHEKLPPEHPLVAPLLRLQNPECPMARFSLLLDIAEILIKYSAAVIVATERQRPTVDKFTWERWCDNLNGNPTLGVFVAILREGLQPRNDSKQPNPVLRPSIEKWINCSGTECTNTIIKTRNNIWGHGATLSHFEYARKSDELQPVVAKLYSIVEPLCTLEIVPPVWSPESGSLHEIELLLESFIENQTNGVRDPEIKTTLLLSPLLCWKIDAGNSCRVQFFNGCESTGSKFKFLDYADGSQVVAQEGHFLCRSFKGAFYRSKQPPPEPEYFAASLFSATQQFSVRQSEFSELLSFAASTTPPQFLVVVGEPGMGKSILLAKLAAEQNAIIHIFNEERSELCSSKSLYLNLGRQLRDSANLQGFPFRDDLSESRALRELKEAFIDAASQDSSPRLIVIDGLDEYLRVNHKAGSLAWLAKLKELNSFTRWVFSCRPEVLLNTEFKQLFGAAKEVRQLPLEGLDRDQIYAFVAKRSPELLDSPSTSFEKLVTASEGNPLYLHLFFSSSPDQQSSLNELPPGLDAYYAKIIDSLAESWRLKSNSCLRAALRELRTQATSESDSSESKIINKFLDKSWAAISQFTNGSRPVDLLALHATAREPVFPATASAVLGLSDRETDDLYSLLRPSLRRGADGSYSTFHAAFREALIRRHPNVVASARRAWARWCAQVLDHRNAYALRHAVDHLWETAKMVDQESATEFRNSARLLLTSLDFIDARRSLPGLPRLLADYDLVSGGGTPGPIAPGPGSLDDYSLSECISGVLAGCDVHMDKWGGPLLTEVRRNDSPEWVEIDQADETNSNEDFETWFTDHHAVEAVLPVENTVPSGTSAPTIIEMLQGGTEPAASLAQSALAAFSRFVRGNLALLGDARTAIGPLAANWESSGPVHDAGLIAAKKAGSAWIRHHGEWHPSPAIRTYDPPLQLIKSDLSVAWRFELDSPYHPPNERSPSGSGTVFRIFRVDPWTTEEVSAHTILLNPEELTVCGFNHGYICPHTLIGDGTRAFLSKSLWNLETGERIAVWPELRPDLDFRWAFSKNGTLGFALLENRRSTSPLIQGLVVDMCALQIVAELDLGYVKEPGAIAVSADGRLGAIGDYHGVTFYDLTTRKNLHRTFIPGYKVRDLTFSPTIRHLAVSDRESETPNSRISIWDLRYPKAPLGTVIDAEESPLLFSPDGRLLLTDSGGIYDASPEACIPGANRLHRLASVPLSCDNRATAFSSCGRYLCAGGHSLYDLLLLKPEPNIRWNTKIKPLISNDGQQVLLVDSHRRVHLRDFGSTTTKRLFVQPEVKTTKADTTGLLAIHEPQETADLVWIGATGSFSSAILIYDDGTFYQIILTDGMFRIVNSPETMRVILDEMSYISEDLARVQGWHEEAPPEKQQQHLASELYWARRKRGENCLPKHYCVSRAALSPCGRFLATSVYGESIRIWSINSGESMHSLPTRYARKLSDGEVALLLFNEDSESVVYVLSDGRTFRWRFRESRHAEGIGKCEDREFNGVGSLSLTDTIIWLGNGGFFSSGNSPARLLKPPGWGCTCLMANATSGICVFHQVPDDHHERLIVCRASDSIELTTWGTGQPGSDSVYSNLSDSGAFVRAGGTRLEYYSLEMPGNP